jgi:predicted metal-dependent phosphoesterase TrpH
LIIADLHVHTRYSGDSLLQPKTIVDQLFAHPFIKAVAITDHNAVQGYYLAQEYASVYQDIVIIPGVEISTLEGDVIILGMAELPPQPLTLENVISFAHDRDSLVIAAHPFREYGLGDQAKDYNFDAIEVLNGTSMDHANRLAMKLAVTLGLPGVAGSDAHKPDELWTAYTTIQARQDLAEILKAIKKGEVRVAKKEKPIGFLKRSRNEHCLTSQKD